MADGCIQQYRVRPPPGCDFAHLPFVPGDNSPTLRISTEAEGHDTGRFVDFGCVSRDPYMRCGGILSPGMFSLSRLQGARQGFACRPDHSSGRPGTGPGHGRFSCGKITRTQSHNLGLTSLVAGQVANPRSTLRDIGLS